MADFIYVLRESEDGSVWAEVPDMPGTHTQGHNEDEIQKHLPDAMSLWQEGEAEVTPRTWTEIEREVRAEGHPYLKLGVISFNPPAP